jgi:O-antigen/teichoic acid export membrane protein
VLTKLKAFYQRVQIYLANTSWIIAEKIVVMGLSFAVTVIVARYLGPVQFGMLAYAISLMAIFGVAGHVGLSGLVVRELVKDTENKNIIMGTSFALKGFGYLIGFLFLLLTALLSEKLGSVEFWVILVVASSLLLRAFDVIDFWFQSILQAKYTAISRTIAAIIASALKLLLVVVGAKLIYFATVVLVQTIISAVLLITFSIGKSELKLTCWRFSKSKAKELFNQGWVVFLGSIFAIIYLKVDQVMLKWLVGSKEVGVYAVAATLSEAWYFVPAAIVASFFPKLIKLKQENQQEYNYRLQQLFDLLFVIALIVAVFITLFAQPVITTLFGSSYTGAVGILVVHVWAALFIFIRAAFSKWILIENFLMFSVISQGLGAFANIGLNYWLIPGYGGLGAAYATLFSYAAASYISLVFHGKTRPVFFMMTKSFFSPIRYLLLAKVTK